MLVSEISQTNGGVNLTPATAVGVGIFFLFFVSVPRARLSWPFCQLLSARKYIVSYRIDTCSI